MNPIWRVVSLLTGNRVALRGPARGSTVYLTFDDGPDPVNTPRTLDVLARHGARASFFMIGKQVRKHPDIVRQVVEAGHSIGNHSMTHPTMSRLQPRAQLEEISQADLALAPFDGKSRHIFRPPHGRATLATITNSVLRDQKTLLWTRDSLDYKLSHEQVVARFNELPPVPRDVLLFHDDMEASWRSLEMLLPGWLDAGFKFDSL